MITTYHDWFICHCGEQYILNIDVVWAFNNQEAFSELVEKQDRHKADHWLCAWKHEVKQFLKTPIIVIVRIEGGV